MDAVDTSAVTLGRVEVGGFAATEDELLGRHRATGEALGNQKITGLVVLDGVELTRVPVTTDGAGKAVVRFDLPGQIARGDGLLTVLVDDGGVTESIQKRIPITMKDYLIALMILEPR